LKHIQLVNLKNFLKIYLQFLTDFSTWPASTHKFFNFS